jgi:hypothetical protein
MAKKKYFTLASDNPYADQYHDFGSPKRPNNDWAYAGPMVPENPREFGSAPSREIMGRYEHINFGIAAQDAHLSDGPSGMDRHVDYIAPGMDNLFKTS